MSFPLPSNPNDNRGPEILGAVTTTTTMAVVVVLARVYTRLRMVRMFGADDWIMLAATLLSVVGLGLVIGQVNSGAGRHIGDLDPAVTKHGLMLNFISQPIYLWAIPLVKISVGIFLLRISPNRFYRNLLLGTMTFLMFYTLFCFFTIMFQCKNIAVLWDFSVKTTCWSIPTILSLSYANSTVNILTDLFFAFIPIPMLWNVQINPKTKASLICILGLGVFASTAAIIKATYLPNYGKTGDFLWDSTNLTIWISTELNTGIMAACLPTLKPMFKRVLDTTLGYKSSSYLKYDKNHELQTYGAGTKQNSRFGSRAKVSVAPLSSPVLPPPPSAAAGTPYYWNGKNNNKHAGAGIPNPFQQHVLHGSSSRDSIMSSSSGGSSGRGITKTTVVVVDSRHEDDMHNGLRSGRTMWRGSDEESRIE